ncbi:MAG: hypothetical protein ACTH4Y_08030 [Microbacterium gubbeenense]|uniref:hypothetical protein n=1 Tax=Microbacterium gubbeenense TaxID=159896 RepID=UPI003F9A2482
MATPKTNTTKTTTPKKTAPKPSEGIDAQLEAEEVAKEVLKDLPELLPAYRFRARHRVAFQNLSLNALKSGAFDGDGALAFDTNTPEGIERYQALLEFVSCVDEWAETIALDADEYAAWSEGKEFDVYMALFVRYREALGESSSSES